MSLFSKTLWSQCLRQQKTLPKRQLGRAGTLSLSSLENSWLGISRRSLHSSMGALIDSQLVQSLLMPSQSLAMAESTDQNQEQGPFIFQQPPFFP